MRRLLQQPFGEFSFRLSKSGLSVNKANGATSIPPVLSTGINASTRAITIGTVIKTYINPLFKVELKLGKGFGKGIVVHRVTPIEYCLSWRRLHAANRL